MEIIRTKKDADWKFLDFYDSGSITNGVTVYCLDEI